jgi:hypothetical protein
MLEHIANTASLPHANTPPIQLTGCMANTLLLNGYYKFMTAMEFLSYACAAAFRKGIRNRHRT